MKINVKGSDIAYDEFTEDVECVFAPYILGQVELLEQLGLLWRSEELNYTWGDSSGDIICYEHDGLLVIDRIYLEIV